MLQVRLGSLTHSNTPPTSHLPSPVRPPTSSCCAPLAILAHTVPVSRAWAVSLVQTQCLLVWLLKYPWKGQGRQCHPGPWVGTEVVTGQWWPAWRHWFCGQKLCSDVSPSWTNSFLPPEELPSSNGVRADNGLELIRANVCLYWRGGGRLQD